MEAKKFIKELGRNCTIEGFKDCEHCNFKCLCVESQYEWTENNINSFIDYIEQWSEEHPVKTRQSEFLERYPNVPLNEDGVINIMPCDIDGRLPSDCCVDCEYNNPIGLCKKIYWPEKIE